MKYRYEALDHSGQDVRGTVEADDTQDALRKIRNMGHYATRIVEDGAAEAIAELAEEACGRPRWAPLVIWGPTALMLVCIYSFSVPLRWMWENDDASLKDVIQANPWSTGVGAGLFCLLSLWVRLRKWATEPGDEHEQGA